MDSLLDYEEFRTEQGYYSRVIISSSFIFVVDYKEIQNILRETDNCVRTSLFRETEC